MKRSFALHNASRRALFAIVAILALGCQRDMVTQPVPDASTLFWRLEAQEPAIVLSLVAPYDTVQLRAVPKTASGNIILTSEPVTFQRLVEIDSSILLDAQGFVTAKKTTGLTRVIASMKIGSITRADTIAIMVRPAVQFIDSLDFAPVAPDSGWRWANSLAQDLTAGQMLGWVRLYDAARVRIPTANILFDFTWDDNSVVGCEYSCGFTPTSYNGALIGETYIRARTYAFGKVVVDSFLFKRVEPTLKHISVRPVLPKNGAPTIVYSPSVLYVRPGTTVIFVNHGVGDDRTTTGGVGDLIKIQRFNGAVLRYVDSIDVIFDEPNRAEPADNFGFIQGQFDYWLMWDVFGFPSDGTGGNIEAFGYKECREIIEGNSDQCGGLGVGVFDDGWRSRKFTQVGTYHYRSTRFPSVQGTIIVRN